VVPGAGGGLGSQDNGVVQGGAVHGVADHYIDKWVSMIIKNREAGASIDGQLADLWATMLAGGRKYKGSPDVPALEGVPGAKGAALGAIRRRVEAATKKIDESLPDEHPAGSAPRDIGVEDLDNQLTFAKLLERYKEPKGPDTTSVGFWEDRARKQMAEDGFSDEVIKRFIVKVKKRTRDRRFSP